MDNSLNDKINTLSWHWRAFPNIGVLGSYEYLSQTVQANSLERRDLEVLVTQKDPQQFRKVIGLFAHELTHWIDHVGTLWGRDLLIKTYNALTARATGNLDEFYRIPQVVSELHRIHFPRYFTEEYLGAKQPWDGQKWKWTFSCGREFGIDGRLRQDRPIVFTRFATQDNVDVCRVPLSIASLTEVNAMAAEIEVDFASLTMIKGDAALIEEKLYTDQFIKQLYDPKTAIYSVAAHCVANVGGVYDATTAYRLASALATACLNLPDRLFDQIRVPESFTIWGDASDHLKAIRDRGFAFLTMAMHAPAYSPCTPEEWVNSAVQSAGLPPLNEISQIAADEMAQLPEPLLPGPFSERLHILLDSGRKCHARRGICGRPSMLLEVLALREILELPPILLGDDTLMTVPPGISGLSNEAQAQWIDAAYMLDTKLREFHEACRL